MGNSSGHKAHSEIRKARLAAALRENLKRRKAGARAQAVASENVSGPASEGPSARPKPAAKPAQ
jgi:hypothetical protein